METKPRVKDIIVKVIDKKIANDFIRKHHYSGKIAAISTLHFGCFLDNKLHGVLSFGLPMDKWKVIGFVKDTGWNEFLELNRMAFDDYLPKNSESRCLSVCIKLIKKNAPHIKWILSFADGTQCGDGTIYRASGFVLTAITKNSTILKHKETGETTTNLSLTSRANGRQLLDQYEIMKGYQFRYIYLIDKNAELTVPIIPFSKIEELGVGMYKGQKR